MNFQETQEFSISLTGDISNEKWVGQFKCLRRLSHRSELQKDRIYRDLLGPNPENAAQVNKDRADILAEISVSLVSVPKWFSETNNGLDLVDNNVITTIWGEIIRIRSETLKEVQDKAQKATEALTKTALATSDSK
jgi:hypothetical protein